MTILDIPVEWVDDHEWNAIQSAFDALSKSSDILDSSRSVMSSSSITAPLAMVPSILSLSSSATPALCHRSGHPTAGQSCSCGNAPQRLKERNYHCRTGISRPNSDGEGGSLWKSVDLLPCKFPRRNVSFGGGGRTLRIQSANNESPKFFSSDNTSSSEQRTETDSSLLECLRESFLPSGDIGQSEMAFGSGRNSREEPLSEVAPSDAEGRELSNKQSARRLPAWMMDPAKQWLFPEESQSSVVEQLEQIRALSGLGGVIVSDTGVEEAETRSAIIEQGNVASAPQHTENRYPDWFQLGQPQVGLPWGLQPASSSDDVKPKFPTMQFRGQIVYSKTESEVSAATDELWRRVHELQETAQGPIPIGFDLEWRPSFEKGEVPRKVAVLQLCLDGRRCDVIQILYSGIPLSLQNLLEAPSTLKVGVGIYGDASKLRRDYQITTRKLADLRVIANQKMKNLKQWSLSSLALELTGKQVEKSKNIRCGDWEALPLSEPQLQYAATDAFASLHLYQVLASLPNPGHENNQGGGDDSKSDPEPPAT